MMSELDEILPFVKKREFTLFIGAGVSAQAGCGLWRDLVKELSEHPLVKREIDEGKALSNDLSDAVEKCFNLLTSGGKISDYRKILRAILDENDVEYRDKYIPLITKLAEIRPFPKSILTINIDDLLSKATREVSLLSGHDILHILKEMLSANKNNKAIFHIHGMRDSLEDALLIKTTIDRRYRSTQFISFLKYFFKNNCILFMGVGGGLRDPNIHKLCKSSNRRHFALIDKNNKYFTKKIIAQYEKEYNIKVVIYGSHNDFKENVERWVNRNFPQSALPEYERDVTQIL